MVVEPLVAPAVSKLVPTHDVASVEDQVSVDVSPDVTDVGLAVRVAVGAGVPEVVVTLTLEQSATAAEPVAVTVTVPVLVPAVEYVFVVVVALPERLSVPLQLIV